MINCLIFSKQFLTYCGNCVEDSSIFSDNDLHLMKNEKLDEKCQSWVLPLFQGNQYCPNSKYCQVSPSIEYSKVIRPVPSLALGSSSKNSGRPKGSPISHSANVISHSNINTNHWLCSWIKHENILYPDDTLKIIFHAFFFLRSQDGYEQLPICEHAGPGWILMS